MTEFLSSTPEWVEAGGRATARLQGTPVPGAGQKVAFSAVAGTSTAIPADVHVMLVATKDCFIRFMTATDVTTATADVDMYMVASVPYVLKMGRKLNSGGTASEPFVKISVVRATADGSLYICPMDGA